MVSRQKPPWTTRNTGRWSRIHNSELLVLHGSGGWDFIHRFPAPHGIRATSGDISFLMALCVGWSCSYRQSQVFAGGSLRQVKVNAQGIGRASRASTTGFSLLLCSGKERPMLGSLALPRLTFLWASSADTLSLPQVRLCMLRSLR